MTINLQIETLLKDFNNAKTYHPCQYSSMFMEDVITRLAEIEYVLGEHDRKFIRSIGKRVDNGFALTTKQGWAFLKVLRNTRLSKHLSMKNDVYDDLLKSPEWKKPLVPSVEIKSEVRYLGDNILAFRTSNGRTEPKFLAMKATYSNGVKYICIENMAEFDVIVEFIGSWGFEMDTSTENYLASCMENIKSPTRLLVEGNQIIIDVPNEHAFAQFAQHVLKAKIV